MFECSPVYHANHNSTADILINQGGTDSGKTVAIIQLLYTYACFTKPPVQDAVITIVSESVPNSKKGAYRIAKSIYNNNKYLPGKIKDWNEGERVITFKSGWIMEFVGTTDEQNAKQGKRQYLFFNEANGMSYAIFWQMAKRTRIRTFIDYNPSAPFWAHEKLINTVKDGNDLNAVVQLIISDHRHNPFLSPAEHAKTENIKDPELWKVYARGLTGNLSGIIYPNWKQIADKDFPWTDDNKFGGLDFGYTTDPTAGVVMCRIADNIYVHEICYATAMTSKQLKSLYRSYNYDDETPVYCEHDGDMIRALRLLEVMAIAARKGPGSIKAGIAKVNEYNVFYTASSKNIDFERKKYMFVKNPVTNKLTNVPTDVDNHLMDAIRYGIYTHYFRQE